MDRGESGTLPAAGRQRSQGETSVAQLRGDADPVFAGRHLPTEPVLRATPCPVRSTRPGNRAMPDRRALISPEPRDRATARVAAALRTTAFPRRRMRTSAVVFEKPPASARWLPDPHARTCQAADDAPRTRSRRPGIAHRPSGHRSRDLLTVPARLGTGRSRRLGSRPSRSRRRLRTGGRERHSGDPLPAHHRPLPGHARRRDRTRAAGGGQCGTVAGGWRDGTQGLVDDLRDLAGDHGSSRLRRRPTGALRSRAHARSTRGGFSAAARSRRRDPSRSARRVPSPGAGRGAHCRAWPLPARRISGAARGRVARPSSLP